MDDQGCQTSLITYVFSNTEMRLSIKRKKRSITRLDNVYTICNMTLLWTSDVLKMVFSGQEYIE